MRRPPLLTVSSDFGSVYAAQVLAVLHRRARGATILPLTDSLPPHRVGESGFLLARMLAGFPPGTIHLAVVDPGVGGRREAVVVELADGSLLLGPNNGLLTPYAETIGVRSVHRIDPGRVRAPRPVSTTFQGRDLFAPAAAALVAGRRTSTLGPTTQLRASPLGVPRRGKGRARGEVVHVDHFGGLVTNIPSVWLPRNVEQVQVLLRRRPRARLAVRRTYEEIAPRELAVLRSSFGTLELSAHARPAAQALRAPAGSPVELRWAVRRRSLPRSGK